MDIKTVFSIFGLLSFAVAVYSLYYALVLYKRKDRENHIFSSFQLYTAGIFVAVLLIFIPVFYYDYELFGEYSIFRPFFIAVHNTIRVFILDGDFDTVADAINGFDNEWVRVPFSFYSAALYITAPILTFGNVLSLFKNIRGEAKLYFGKKRPMYIMSELNVCSLAMAESIVNQWKALLEKSDKKRPDKKTRALKPVIVFTDVFEQNEEDDYELLVRARSLGAICLKKDISHLNLSEKSSKIEIFLIGENESENVEHSIKLTESYKTRKNVSIYVFATSAGAGYVIDSLDKGENTLDDKFEDYIIEKPRELLYGDSWKKDDIQVDGGFYIRRVNCVEALVKNTLDNETVHEAVRKSADENDKIISVLIIGMGKYGKQFFKTLLWFYQLEGYKLEINIFDADINGTDSIKKQLEQECPELIQKNPSDENGDANYDIRFFSGINCFTSDFDKCFDSSENGRRLKRTNLAFVTLGDDDKNIEAAVMLRKLFDRKKHYTKNDVKNADAYEMPIINAVVYDEQKASNLSAHGSMLKNHKGQDYHVNFIGDRASQYNYRNIEENRKVEHSAFKFHIDWLRKTAQLRHFYETDPDFRSTVDKNRTNPNEPIYWDDEYIFLYKDADGKTDFDGAINSGEVKKIASDYVNYEYFRRSSIAKAMHKNITKAHFSESEGHNDICTCSVCESKRKTEHMRWNAYMRSEGYIVGVRNDRGKTHPNLCTYQELPYLERFKD